jgi:hypothetical protein
MNLGGALLATPAGGLGSRITDYEDEGATQRR